MEVIKIEVEKLKQESIRRMKILKVDKQIIEDFEKNNTIYVSNDEGNAVKANDVQLQILKDFEATKKVKIYYIIENHTSSKEILYFLYVDKDVENWKDERRDNALGYAVVLCYKKLKEIKEIGILCKNGKIKKW